MLCIEKRTLFLQIPHTPVSSLVPEKLDEKVFSSLGTSFGLFLFQYANPRFSSFFYRNYIYLIARGFLFLIFNEQQKERNASRFFCLFVSKGILRSNREGLRFGDEGGSGCGWREKSTPV